MKKKKAGFTLIELLIVMTIISVLAGLALVSYQGTRKTARDGKRKAELEEIRSALEMYRTDNGTYPDTGSWTTDLSTYMEVPSDPLADRNYAFNSAVSTYNLCAALEIDTGDDFSGVCGSCGQTCNYRATNP